MGSDGWYAMRTLLLLLVVYFGSEHATCQVEKRNAIVEPEHSRKTRFTFHTNQLVYRVLGTVLGVVFLAIGSYSLLGGSGLDPYTEDRARGFGLAALVAGVWAIAASWLYRDLSNVWCRPPSRWGKSRRDG